METSPCVNVDINTNKINCKNNRESKEFTGDRLPQEKDLRERGDYSIKCVKGAPKFDA